MTTPESALRKAQETVAAMDAAEAESSRRWHEYERGDHGDTAPALVNNALHAARNARIEAAEASIAAIRALAAQAEDATQPREQAGTKFGKPLDKPARVGATVFRVGVGSDLVVQRAQREYEYHLNPPPYDKAVLQAALAAAQCTCAQTPGAGCSNCPPDAAPCPRAEGVDGE